MSIARSHLSILEDIKYRAFAEKKASSLVDFYNNFVAIIRELKRVEPQISSDQLQSQAESALFSRYWPNENVPFQDSGNISKLDCVTSYKPQFPMMYEKAKGDCEICFTREHKRLSGNYRDMASRHNPDFANYRLEQLMWEALWPKERFPGIDPTPARRVVNPTPTIPTPARTLSKPAKAEVDKFPSRVSDLSPTATQSLKPVEKAVLKPTEPILSRPQNPATAIKVVLPLPPSSQTPHPSLGSANLFSRASAQLVRETAQLPPPTQAATATTAALSQLEQESANITATTASRTQPTNSAAAQILQGPMQHVSTQTEDSTTSTPATIFPLLPLETAANSCLAKINSFLETISKDYTNLKPLSTALHCQLRIEQVRGSETYPLRVFVEPQFVRTPPNYTQAVKEANRARRMLGEWGRGGCVEVWEMIADAWERGELQGTEERGGKRKRV